MSGAPEGAGAAGRVPGGPARPGAGPEPTPTPPEASVPEGFEAVLEGWDGLGAMIRHDAPTGTWIFVAIHDVTMGRAVGGCRMRVYERPEQGLWDALRLARGMTYKWASIDIPFGGGKSVLAVPRPLEGEERRGLLHRFGALLNGLGGAYATGEDLGTTPSDMAELATVTRWVKGVDPEGRGLPTDPGPFTARGVFEAMRAGLAHRFGSPDLEGRTVVVQGAGDVGAPLARLIAAAGGRVCVADVNAERARALADEVGGEVIAPEAVYDAPCDVYAPCAVGATLNPTTIPRLRCAVVAGSANNQLLSEADAQALAARGILYTPDYVTNAGGALAFGLLDQGVTDVAELERRVAGLGEVMADILAGAEREGITPLEAARRRAERRLAERRAERG